MMARQLPILQVVLASGLLLVGAHGEEEQPAATPVESAISVMLLGSIGFQMLLFYLVHWPDPDIKRYSWRVISQTISIFCAVLLFQAFNGMVEEYVIKGGSTVREVAVDIIQLVWWLTAMQVFIAVTSGAVNDMWGGGEPSMDKVILNVNSLAVLFSHVAGFSAINAWGSLQQHLFQDSPASALLVVPIGYAGLYAMYQGYDHVRTRISKSDDGEIDEFEKIWDEQTEESENDVAGLSLSFLTVQAVRFAIGGVLPNQEGAESLHTANSHGGDQWVMLVVWGLVFGLCGIGLLNIERCVPEPSERLERILEIMNNYFTFGNAWCFFYGVKWMISATHFTGEAALLHVVLALFLSTAAFMLIFVLDKVMDNHVFGEDSDMADRAAEKMITGLGILIGFSWEQCFDTAVSVIASSIEDTCPEALSKLVMSCILVVVVFPAWRLYILPMERELADETTEEGQKKATLKAAAEQHYKLMMANDTDDHVLDLAHLRMKQHRRTAHDKPPHPALSAPGLKHLQVTVKGIKELERGVDTQEAKRKNRSTHCKNQEQPNLLE